MKIEAVKLHYKETWCLEHRGLSVEITHWGHTGENAFNEGQGVWNYYVYIPERLTKRFNELWLEDKLVKYAECSPERVHHDYMQAEFADQRFEWHGGITYYDKHGHTPGHRCVQLGCDFNHLWDHERGYDYVMEEVAYEAVRTAKLLADYYEINVP